MARVLRGLSGLFLGGYAFIKAVARLLRAGAGGHDADTSLGVVVERQLPRMAPKVPVAAGLGLIEAVIRTSLEAV